MLVIIEHEHKHEHEHVFKGVALARCSGRIGDAELAFSIDADQNGILSEAVCK